MTTYRIKPLSRGRPRGVKKFDEETAKALGLAIRVIRLKKEHSQEELADGIGMDRSHISRIERGINAPAITAIFKMADFLNVRPAEIIDLAERILKKEFKVEFAYDSEKKRNSTRE